MHQSSLSAIMALASSGIASPADLPGRTIGDQPGSTIQVMFPVYAAAAGTDADQVTFVPSQPPQLPTLLASGQVDAIGQFVVGQHLIENAAGEPAAVLPYSDVLPDLYGNALITNTENAGIAAAEVELMAPAVGTGDQIGSLDRDKVQGTLDILVESGAIEAGLTPDDLVAFDLLPAS